MSARVHEPMTRRQSAIAFVAVFALTVTFTDI